MRITMNSERERDRTMSGSEEWRQIKIKPKAILENKANIFLYYERCDHFLCPQCHAIDSNKLALFETQDF